MIDYRAFLNSDPPHLVKMWNQLAPIRWLMQPVSVSVLERRVFSKPYFDRQGLILAVDDSRIVGLVHAGFGPNDTYSDLSQEVGVICLLLVQDRPDQLQIRRQLIARAEEYLVARGSRELRTGEFDRRSPFYLGLYGGSGLTGILQSDVHNIQALTDAGFVPREETRLLKIAIADFRPVMDRELIQNRRKFNVEAEFDVRSRNRWEASQFGQIDRFRFRLRPRPDGPAAGEVTFWDMGPTGLRLGMSTMGLTDLAITENQRVKGLGTFLVSEAIRQVQAIGIGGVFVQVPRKNEPANRLFAKLGFVETDVAVSFGKTV